MILVGSYLLIEEIRGPLPEDQPPLVVPTTDGGTFDLADHRGRVVVVDFFATWCEPCHFVESQLLDVRVAAPDAVLVSVGVDLAEPLDELAAYKEAHNLTWPVGKAEADDIRAWSVDTLAHVAVVHGDGRVHDRLIGTPDADEILAAIAAAR